MKLSTHITAILSLCLMAHAHIAGAQQTSPQMELVDKPCNGKTAARVGVFFSGVVELNGKPIFVADLGKLLRDGKTVTEVCYYRERPEAEEAPKQIQQVINAVIEARLPVAFYWDAQFQKRVSLKQWRHAAIPLRFVQPDSIAGDHPILIPENPLP